VSANFNFTDFLRIHRFGLRPSIRLTDYMYSTKI